MMVYVHGGDAEPNGPNRRPTRVLSDSSKVMGFESSESEPANDDAFVIVTANTLYEYNTHLPPQPVRALSI